MTAQHAKFFGSFLYETINQESGTYKTDCPFCGKANHFYIDLDTTKWVCNRCGLRGNDRGFITEYHRWILTDFTREDFYHELSEIRGIDPIWYKRAQWAYDPEECRWFVPYFNGGDFLAQLKNFYDIEGQANFRCMACPNTDSINSVLYNPFKAKLEGTVVICEGEWDALAFADIFGIRYPYPILATPGANTFKKEWLDKTLKDVTKVILVYDCDEAGTKGRARAAEMIAAAGKAVDILDWAAVDTPSSYEKDDIRDMLLHFGRKEAKQYLEPAFLPMSSPDNGPTKPKTISAGYAIDVNEFEYIKSYEEYLDRIPKSFYLTAESKLALAACIGLNAAIKQDGEMLWAFLVGPPSCGKTTFIESFGGSNQYFEFMSKITAKALVSGYKDETGEDSSFITRMDGKGNWIKDFTVTIAADRQERNEVFGLLRDISDGTVKIPYGNNQIKEYHGIKFNMIAGVTDAIHGVNTALLGERFLKIDYLGKNYNSRSMAKQALRNLNKKSTMKKDFTAATLGFVRYLYDTWQSQAESPLNDATEDLIIDYASMIAMLRVKPENDRSDGIKYIPRAELEPRLSLQLADLLMGISHVFGKSPNDPQPLKVLGKVARDTIAGGFVYNVVEHIFQSNRTTRDQLGKALNIRSSTRIHRLITDLTQTGVIVTERISSGRRGHPTDWYALSPKMSRIMEALE